MPHGAGYGRGGGLHIYIIYIYIEICILYIYIYIYYTHMCAFEETFISRNLGVSQHMQCLLMT